MEEECFDDSGGMSWVSVRCSLDLHPFIALISVIFGIFFVLNTVLWINGSSAAIPFSTFIALLALWFCVSTPLVFAGAYMGFKRPVRHDHRLRSPIHFDIFQPAQTPVRTNQIPREIPEQSLYTKALPGNTTHLLQGSVTRLFVGVLMGGILPFGCIFIQLFFILNSIW